LALSFTKQTYHQYVTGQVIFIKIIDSQENGHQEINPGGHQLVVNVRLKLSINNTPDFVSAVVTHKKRSPT